MSRGVGKGGEWGWWDGWVSGAVGQRDEWDRVVNGRGGESGWWDGSVSGAVGQRDEWDREVNGTEG